MKDWRKADYVIPGERKTGLLLGDDFRMPSGVGTMCKEIVMKTLHKYNWIQVGGAIKHPEAGKILDMSKELERITGVPNYTKIYPYNGYGDPDLIRYLIQTEKPDFILHFTDPRFYIWLYQMEHELRQVIPILYYTIWDDLPFPRYNEDYYESCDALFAISKQTYNIVKQVRHRKPVEDWQLKYIPHGIDENIFRPIVKGQKMVKIKDVEIDEYDAMLEFKKDLFNGKDYKYIVLYNNRNIRRKNPGDVILAFKKFYDELPEEKKNETCLLMHTAVVDQNGTDLGKVKMDLAPEVPIFFTQQKFEPHILNFMYNISSVTINLASNEGFGLATCESLMAGTPIIATVTGGLQDQMGFKNESGKYLDPDVDFNENWASNHDGKFKNHGEWCIPVFPSNRSLAGSPPTPYIFDDRPDFADAADAIRKFYDMGESERNRVGELGRQFVTDPKIGMTSQQMGLSFIKNIDEVLNKWEPRERFTLINANGTNKPVYKPTGVTYQERG